MAEMYDQILTHSDDAKNRQVWQYKGKENLDKIIEIHAERIQLLENVLYEVLTKRAISTGSGEQLDRLGEFLDVPRDGVSDGVYRINLSSAASKLRKAGQVEILLDTLRAVTEIDDVSLLQVFPASLLMHVFVDDFTDIENQETVNTQMQKVKAAGINLDIGLQLNSSVFRFSDSLLGGTAGEGFATTTTSEDGGTFARIFGLYESYALLSELSFLITSEDGIIILSDTGTE